MREEFMADKTTGPLTFGFDIGIASVGWCVLGENRIVDLGVRCFDKAETAKEGESLNLARRMARLMRRRLRRRAWRLTKVARLLKRERLIDDTRFFLRPTSTSPWHLRVDGLDRKLDANEWARAIYHLRCMTVTEKQYAGMRLLVGLPLFQEKKVAASQMLLF
jgi:CRISPR-associated endonuclease Csn1